MRANKGKLTSVLYHNLHCYNLPCKTVTIFPNIWSLSSLIWLVTHFPLCGGTKYTIFYFGTAPALHCREVSTIWNSTIGGFCLVELQWTLAGTGLFCHYMEFSTVGGSTIWRFDCMKKKLAIWKQMWEWKRGKNESPLSFSFSLSLFSCLDRIILFAR